MRIIELTREAAELPKPLPILPQGVQTPPPAKPASPAAAPAAVNPAPTAPAAAKPNAAVGNRPMGTPGQRPNPAVGYSPLPKPAQGDPAAFGGGVVNPPSKSGVVSKAELDNYRRDSGNPNATLGQYMNQQQGKTFRKGGANDPAVIAARQQTAGPPVGSQAQTASGKNELAKQNIAANKPPAAAPAAPAPAAPVTAAPVTAAEPAASAPINPLRGNFSVAGPSNAGSSSNNATQPANPMRGIQTTNPNASNYDADAAEFERDKAELTGQQPAPVSTGSGGTVTTSDGSAVTTRTANQIGDTNPRTGVVTPGSFDKNRAQGQKNLDSVKNFFGFNKPTPGNTDPNQGKVDYNTQTAKPITTPVNTDPNQGKVDYSVRTANPLRGVKESTGMQDPVLVRMQNLAGIRR